MIENVASGVEGMTSNAFLAWGPQRPAGDGSTAGTEETGAEPGRRVLVDCGANFDVVSAVNEHVSNLDAVVLTHTHPDHVGTLPALRKGFDVETWGFDVTLDEVDHAIADGDSVRLGTDDYEVLHTPGHKDDHVCLYDPESGVLFAGDLVFAHGGFGRTDLAEGDRQTLIDSVDRLLDRIDGCTALYAGHGPAVTDDPRAHVEHAARAARASRGR